MNLKDSILRVCNFQSIVCQAMEQDLIIKSKGVKKIVTQVIGTEAVGDELKDCVIHHTAYYCGDYLNDDEVDLFYKFLKDNQDIKYVEYGPSYISPKEYDTPGWWFSVDTKSGQHIELFTCKAFGEWGRTDLETKVKLMSHVAVKARDEKEFYRIVTTLFNDKELRRIMLTERDCLGHTYSHFLNIQTNLVMEFIHCS